MIAVSNTSPLIVLAKSGYLENLPKIFKCVIIPNAVFNEIFRKEDVATRKIRDLINFGFIQTEKVKNKELVDFINTDIGLGEAETIVLSLQLKPDYLLIDDYEARIYAKEISIKVIGTLGLIRVFRENNLIRKEVETIYKQLISANFWINKDLFFKVMGR